ncbi:MAG: terpene cyclase/mutase family protein [Planctomycetes bacterium]|nr:terpene cyclase/mutase family protein [Planctomycetota bacterium]
MAGQTISSTGAAGVHSDPGSGRGLAAGLLRQVPAWAVSMLVHIIILLAMALIVSEAPKADLRPKMIVSNAPESAEDIGDLADEMPDQLPMEEVTDPVVVPDAAVENVQVVADAEDLSAPAVAVELSDFGSEMVQPSDLLAGVGGIAGQAGGLGGRTDPKMRQQLVLAGGGNAQTEAAVEAALKWFISHQMPDGGWSFDLAACPSCQGQCSHSGKSRAKDRCGATALALLPFLGRGYTHREGPYKKQLDAGIAFLAGMSLKGEGKCYGEDGTLYSQGLAGIVLSESYAMSKDPRLQLPAQLALNFIMTAQDPVGGGWRYSPKQPGDTSAVGWQLMALKSGDMANLRVNPLTVKKAVAFLDSVQSDDGAAYGYTDKSTPGPARNAVGLLCRMYLGWKKNNPALQRGVANLAKAGPSKDLYHNYYATQVLHHLEGDAWTAWNTRMRDLLLNTQAKRGHEAGSWYDGVDSGHGADAAGRLYCTALSAMILEVYYRHLPIYGQQSVEEDFRE